MRRFVVIGQRATASGDFIMDDLPGTSGRLDVLLRCARAALLVSHGLRRDTIAYLVLLGGPHAPRILRIDGAAARFVRPDDRSLGLLAKKTLTICGDRASAAGGFVEFRAGIALARGGLPEVLADLGGATPWVLDEGGVDVRDAPGLTPGGDAAIFVGDDLGFDAPTRATLAAIGARPLRVGPVSVHAEDAVTIVSNELDRMSSAGVQLGARPRT